MLLLYDGNNYYRTKLENRIGMQAPREILGDIWDHPERAHVFVWDGRNNNEYRRDIYPGYKSGRKPAHESIFQHIKLLKAALQHTAAFQISMEGYEADDVIAALAISSNKQVVIMSNDYDFEQLRIYPHIHPGCKSKGHVEPHHVQLYKSMVGDPSDTIKGIPGFGDQAWRKLDVTRLRHLMDDNLNYADVTELIQCGMSKKCAAWLLENVDEWEAMYTVAGFRSIPDPVLLKHIKPGRPDRAKCYGLLEEFMQ